MGLPFVESQSILAHATLCRRVKVMGLAHDRCLLAGVGQNSEDCLDTLKGDTGHGLLEGISPSHASADVTGLIKHLSLRSASGTRFVPAAALKL